MWKRRDKNDLSYYSLITVVIFSAKDENKRRRQSIKKRKRKDGDKKEMNDYLSISFMIEVAGSDTPSIALIQSLCTLRGIVILS